MSSKFPNLIRCTVIIVK